MKNAKNYILLALTTISMCLSLWLSVRLAVECDLTARLMAKTRSQEIEVRKARAIAVAQAIRVADVQRRCPEAKVLHGRSVNIRMGLENDQ